MAAHRSTADILDAAVHVREVARNAASGAAGVDPVLAALTHIEHILAKLDLPNRAAAAARAVAWGIEASG
jgi:hypothetical protein